MHFMRTIAIGALVVAITHCGKPHDTDAPKPAPTAGATEPTLARANTGGTRVGLAVDELPIMGDALALVTIVEFTDFECPFCARADGVIAKLREMYPADQLRVAVAMHPLASHAHARPAALAALAAAEQGKIEAMQTQLFANAKSLDDPGIRRTAALVGLDMQKFEAARQAPKASMSLAHAEALGKSADINGTPTFFVNGRRVIGLRPLETIKTIIDEELVNARALLERGVRRENLYTEILKTPAPPDLVDDEEGCLGAKGEHCPGGCNGPDSDGDADENDDEPSPAKSLKRRG